MDNNQFTPEVIAQQREICDKATPGPWAVSVANEYPYDDIGSGLTGEHVAICGSKNANTQFIITARTVLPAALDALEVSMAREAEKDATIARCGRKVQFIAQQRDTWRKASERLADHEKDLQQTIAALTESNKDALKDVLYYKAYNDRLRNALSRPERDYLDEIDHLTAERDAEKKRADAAEKDLKTVCTLAIDEGADCACCAVCKHSRGMPPLGSSDDCDILRYDEKTDEIIGKCKWEWRGPCAENVQEENK